MLVLAGFALMFILPLAMLFLSVSNSTLGESSIIQAKTVARTIADEAGEIYLQGAGARKMIIVNYPEGIAGARIDEKLVVLSVDADNRKLDIVGATFANITGDLSARKKAGLQRILLVNENGNYVNITYG